MESFPQEWKEKQVLQGWQLLNHDMLPSGEGGYGKVYKIAKEDTGETAALKWIRIKTDSKQQMSEAHRRLSTEIKVMYDMSSVPQIVHIQDYAIMDNEDELCVDALIRMEWLQPLKERIRKLKLQDVAQIATDISEALKQLHAKNLVHEDVKLENILYGDGIYKLSDFGCASYLSSSVVGRPGGTSFYRAPEYLQKEAVPSFVGDIYSLGMTFYLLFNDGKLPYQKTGISTTAAYEEMKRACAKGAGHYPPPADAVAPIADVIAKATAIQPEARYQRVEDFKRELCQAIAQLPLKTPLHEDGDRGTQSASSHKPRRPFSSSNHQAQSVYQTSQTAAVRTAEHTKRTQDGFQIPQNEAEAPAAQEEKPAEVPESKRRGHLVRWVLAIAAVMLVAGMMVLLRLVHQENITVAAANCTNVILQAKEEKQAQIHYYALGTPNHAVEQSISRWPVELTGLIPATTYEAEISTASGTSTLRFTTKAVESNRSATRQYQALYVASKAEIAQKLEQGMTRNEMLLNGVYQPVDMPWKIQLRNGSTAYQDVEYLLYAEFQRSASAQAENIMTGVILRIGKEEVYAVQKEEGYILPNLLIKMYFPLDDLFAQRWEEKQGTQYYGSATLEMYCGDDLVANGTVSIEEE